MYLADTNTSQTLQVLNFVYFGIKIVLPVQKLQKMKLFSSIMCMCMLPILAYIQYRLVGKLEIKMCPN